MSDEPGVIQLVIEVLDSGKSPEEVCRLWPNHLEEVRRRVARCRVMESRLEDLFPSSEDSHGGQQANFAAELPQIPLYEVQALIGHGGMGVVYRAQHLKLKRLVALKMIRSGAYASPNERSRFFLEAEAIAALRHANIVQVYDLGEVEGRPYFTMEFLGGGSLAQKLAGGPFPPAQAARYLVTLATAVQAAHSAGIVHRDLKPANVLLSVDGQVKISDFGLARRMAADEVLTFGGAHIGTPSYMAPEQASGRLTTIGPSADIYALGAILYEMLTGRPPFLGDSAAETERQVINDDPASPRRLNTAVPRDLETICLKCLHKDPARRYANPADLAADADRYLRGEPIHARPVGPVERAVKWTRRHRGLAASLAGVALALVLLAVVSLLALAHFRTMGLQQQTLAREKGKLADEKEIERGKAVAAERAEAGLRQETERRGEEIRRNLYLSQMNLADQAALSPSGIGYVHELLMPWESGVPDLRNWEWYYLNGICNRDLLTFRSHLDGVVCVAWSPDGRKLASADADGIVVIWDKSDGRESAHFRADRHIVNSVAWSPDGKRIATAGHDHTVRTWNAATGAPMLTLQASETIVHAVAWSPDGTRLAAGDHAGDVEVWNADTGANIHILHGHNGAVFAVAWSPDGVTIASGGEDHSVRLWDPIGGDQRKILGGHRNWVRAVAWNRDGSRLASASNDQTAKIWDPNEGKELLTLTGHTQAVTSVAWSPDGTRLVTGSDDQTLKIWQPDTPTALYSLRGHVYPITSVAWSPDGALFASASYDTTVKIWDAAAGPELLTLEGQRSSVPALAWQKDSRHLASVSFDRTITVWDVRRQGKPLVFPGNAPRMLCAAWSPDGRWLASADMDRTIHVCDATNGKELKTLIGHTAKIRALVWSPDSQRLASAGEDQSIRIWDAPSGTQVQIFKGNEKSVSAVAWNPDGKAIASGSVDGMAKLWNATDGVVTQRLKGHTSEIPAVAWSPDGQRLAAANVDQAVTIFSTASGKLLFTLHGHTARVIDVAWSPSGTRLASASDDNTVKLWDPLTGKQALTLEGGRHMYAVAWSPDGMLLASCGNDSTVLVHDATAGYAAALTEPYLAVLDRRIAADPNDSADWLTKAQVHAGMSDWNSAEADLRKYLALKPDEHWCPLGYWVVGPYPEDMTAHFPPEIDPDPAKHVLAQGTVGPLPTFLDWQRVPVNSTGFVNFRGPFGYVEHISAYALLKIYCPKQQKVNILLGASDRVRLWLNGQQIHENLTQRGAFPDSDVVAATLTPGWNNLLARVANATGTHAMYLRLSDAPGDPAKTGGEPTK